MLLHNSKISVLRSMMGFGEDKEAQIVVPQNSVSTIRQKGGSCQVNEQATGTNPAIIPAENTLRRSEYPTNFKCPHCENMAKNFLYLESLIRSNYNNTSQCSLCYSALKYLQYVNKSIMQVFGNFDSIVQAAKAFSNPQRRVRSEARKKPRKNKLNTSTHSTSPGNQNKQKTIKKKLRTVKAKSDGTTTTSSKPSSRSTLDRSTSKRSNLSSKNSMKAKSKSTMHSSHSVRTAEGVFENGSKVIKGKKKANARKAKTSTPLRGIKVKGKASKHKN